VPVTAGPGILVVRFTPADNHAELVYRDGVQVPVQTDPTYEFPVALMSAGAMFDRRAMAIGAEVSALANADVTVSALNPTYGIVPGCQIVLWGVGRYLLTHSADIDVTTAGTAGNLLYAAPQFSGPITSGVPTTLRQFIDLNQIRRDVRTAAYPIEVTAPAAAVITLGVCMGAANGVVVCRSTTGVTWIHARRIG